MLCDDQHHFIRGGGGARHVHAFRVIAFRVNARREIVNERG